MNPVSTRIRILLLADSHLGFDLPMRTRIERRRRGHDFLANHDLALEPAKAGRVDLVVHGGDMFHRPRVHPSLVFQAFRPLLEIAERGVPVFVVPGNHERSRIPHDWLGSHPDLHIFRRPETVMSQIRGVEVAVSGFPYERRGIRERFPQVLQSTGWDQQDADLRILCMHHCVEGATVGPGNFTFRHAPDVIRCADLPVGFAAVLSGHIHRHQRLRQDLQGRPLPTPVLYPGSVERTAFAEMGEEKGFILMEAEPGADGGALENHVFKRLPSRPMIVRELRPRGGSEARWTPGDLEGQVRTVLSQVPVDAVLRLRIQGHVPPYLRPLLSAGNLRRLAPAEMNLEVVIVEDQDHRRAIRSMKESRKAPGSAPLESQIQRSVL